MTAALHAKTTKKNIYFLGGGSFSPTPPANPAPEMMYKQHTAVLWRVPRGSRVAAYARAHEHVHELLCLTASLWAGQIGLRAKRVNGEGAGNDERLTLPQNPRIPSA